jgi:hypothetical protein
VANELILIVEDNDKNWEPAGQSEGAAPGRSGDAAGTVVAGLPAARTGTPAA